MPQMYDELHITQREAEEAASDDLLCTPQAVVAWLSMKVRTTDPQQSAQRSVGELLSLILGGANGEATAARYELRDRFLADHSVRIEAAAREIMRRYYGRAA